MQSRDDGAGPFHAHHPDRPQGRQVKEQSLERASGALGFAGEHRADGFQARAFGFLDDTAIHDAQDALAQPMQPLHFCGGFLE